MTFCPERQKMLNTAFKRGFYGTEPAKKFCPDTLSFVPNKFLKK